MLGLDLGQNAAMSAAAAYFRDGRLEAQACFPELPSLSERGLSDGVGDLYCRMAERGELFQAGRRVSDVAVLLRECLERWGRPVAIACDRWRLAELKEKLEAVRFPLAELVERGQGFKDGGQDVRDFRKAVLGDHVRPSRSLLLRAAMAEARVTGDPSGNWKLAKHVQGGRRANARDDACAAGGSRCGGVSSRSQARKRQALHRRVCEGMAHVNGMESFWSMMKRGFHGTYHRMTPKHLQRYVSEFGGRHNIRDRDTIDQMIATAAGLVGNDALVLFPVAGVAPGQRAQRHRSRHEAQGGIRFAGADKLVHLIEAGESPLRLG